MLVKKKIPLTINLSQPERLSAQYRSFLKASEFQLYIWSPVYLLGVIDVLLLMTNPSLQECFEFVNEIQQREHRIF